MRQSLATAVAVQTRVPRYSSWGRAPAAFGAAELEELRCSRVRAHHWQQSPQGRYHAIAADNIPLERYADACLIAPDIYSMASSLGKRDAALLVRLMWGPCSGHRVDAVPLPS
jgi:hypothetical protein